ncbi:TonB-dependent receptor [Membranihabitans marinus]|uniref:TonB-dependent receptor n=1 Tax=Membranihabitans marinus TaxID=1227546 RepID=UPI001F33B30D|nr:TonB-dependent receptor plug domain-containing protein [Membranihabitans marinus]
MRYEIICLLILISCLLGRSQNPSFKVYSSVDGENLIGATLLNISKDWGAITNDKGIAYLKADRGDSVRISYVGFKDSVILILDGSAQYNIELEIKQLQTVVILSPDQYIAQSKSGREYLPLKFLNTIPGITGQSDILKSITLLPGVNNGREGYAHLLVRGGLQEQNLLLFDGATLFNVNHAAGIISLLDPAIIQNVDFYKNYWPSHYGGRLSSVMSVQTLAGQANESEKNIDISLISPRISMSGPLTENGNTTYNISARTTFLDLFFLPRRQRIRKRKTEGDAFGYTFYDVNGHIQSKIDDQQSIDFSFYHGKDINVVNSYIDVSDQLEDEFKYRLNNILAAINYQWLPNRKLRWRLHLSHSRHSNHLGVDEFVRNVDFQQETEFTTDLYESMDNAIQSTKASIGGKFYSDQKLSLDYGLEWELLSNKFQYRYQYQFVSNINTEEDRRSATRKQPSLQTYAPYVDVELNIAPNLHISVGSRFPQYVFENTSRSEIEPKAIISYQPHPKSTINLAYNHQTQAIHFLYYNADFLFAENFILSNADLSPAFSDQYSLEYRQNLDGLLDNIGIALYYKHQYDIIKYQPPTEEPLSQIIAFDKDLHRNGKIWSRGLEWMVQKTKGKFHSSLAYTWSQTKMQFLTLNQGRRFDSDFDFRHQINALWIYQVNDEYKLSAQWIYQSGRPITWSNEKVRPDDLFGIGYSVFDNINNFRLPANHRLDLGIKRTWISSKTGKEKWFSLNLYNAYYRKNPYTVENIGNAWKIRSIFPIIPSFNIGFKF